MKYIVYLTINIVNLNIYVGVHQTNKKFDGYIGCGVYINRPSSIKYPKTPFQYAVKKYGFKSFKRITLFTFNTAQEAYEMERLIVNQEFLKREDTYNLVLGGRTHPEVFNTKKAVYMFDLDGNFIKEFSGVNIAAKSINKNAKNGSHISRAIRQGLVYQGYQWSYSKDSIMKKRTARSLKTYTVDNTKPVGRFDLQTNELLETFDTLTECRKAGYQNANKVLAGKRKSCKGYSFQYLN